MIMLRFATTIVLFLLLVPTPSWSGQPASQPDFEVWQDLERVPVEIESGTLTVRLRGAPFEFRTRHPEVRICLSRRPFRQEPASQVPRCLSGRRIASEKDALTIDSDGYNTVTPSTEKRSPGGWGVINVRYLIDGNVEPAGSRVVPLIELLTPIHGIVWIDVNRDQRVQLFEAKWLNFRFAPEFMSLIPAAPPGWTAKLQSVRAFKSRIGEAVEGFVGMAGAIAGHPLEKTVFDAIEIRVDYSHPSAGSVTLALSSMDLNGWATIEVLHQDEQLRREAVKNGVKPVVVEGRKGVRTIDPPEELALQLSESGTLTLVSSGPPAEEALRLVLHEIPLQELSSFLARPEEWRPH